jgi:hypothetical protein
MHTIRCHLSVTISSKLDSPGIPKKSYIPHQPPLSPCLSGKAGIITNIHKTAILYVSIGTCTWGPPIRFLALPEVTVIEFVNSEKGQKKNFCCDS